MKEKKALILIAHGSRVTQTADEMNLMVAKLSEECDYDVYGAFMELQQPRLDEVVEQLCSAGPHHIKVLPLFVFEGRHMREDIPQQVDKCRELFTECSFDLLPYIGSTDYFINALKGSVSIL